MSGSLLLVVFIILVALAFDYINGFHDAANSIATVVSTRVLTPMQAVAWAAFFNFVAAFGFGVQVARTVGKGVVDAGIVDQWVILGGLVGAITWNLITWYYGIPSSSSHALIGGYAGAAVAKAGFGGPRAERPPEDPGLHRAGARARPLPGLHPDGDHPLDGPVDPAQPGGRALPPTAARSPPPPTAWATAPTTRRRRWGSSRSSSSRPATSGPSSTFPCG